MARLLSIAPGVLERPKQLPRAGRVECLLALCDVVEAFGQPHVHAGLGIRKLGEKLFQCRSGLALRFVSQHCGIDLYVSFLGDHDEVKALLKRGAYR